MLRTWDEAEQLFLFSSPSNHADLIGHLAANQHVNEQLVIIIIIIIIKVITNYNKVTIQSNNLQLAKSEVTDQKAVPGKHIYY